MRWWLWFLKKVENFRRINQSVNRKKGILCTVLRSRLAYCKSKHGTVGYCSLGDCNMQCHLFNLLLRLHFLRHSRNLQAIKYLENSIHHIRGDHLNKTRTLRSIYKIRDVKDVIMPDHEQNFAMSPSFNVASVVRDCYYWHPLHAKPSRG
jgi:hypothetical protein